MLGLLFLLFVAAPVTELIILVRLGQAFGLLATLVLVFGTGFAGAALARAQGTRVLAELQRELAAGRVPGQQLLDGMAILVGGAALLAPGFLTDLVGLALLFPPTRSWLQAAARRWLERQLDTGALRVSVLRWRPGSADMQDQPPRGLDPRREIRMPPSDPKS